MLTETKVSGQLETLYGIMAEFDDPESLLHAANRARLEGYREMDAYAPMPVEGLAEAIGFRSNWVQRLVFVGGLCGAIGGFMLCWWITVVAYPHNVAGRPLNSWPAYVPDHVRTHGADRVYYRCGWNAHAQRTAAAVSPGIQRRTIRARLQRQILLVHRGVGSKVRASRHAAISGTPESAGGDGCCALGVSCCLLGPLVMIGCRQDMHNQPRYKPLAGTDFFGDGRSARPVVEGTVARGHLRIDKARYTGKEDGKDVTEFPFPITRADLLRGQARFNIYCSPCHSRIGDGNGMVVRRGFRQAASYHTDKLIKAPVGHFFDVMTNGFGAMPSYASRVESDDRWRIAAYIRVLQLSENARIEDVPADSVLRWRRFHDSGGFLHCADRPMAAKLAACGHCRSTARCRWRSCSTASSSYAPISLPISTGPAWRWDAWPSC